MIDKPDIIEGVFYVEIIAIFSAAARKLTINFGFVMGAYVIILLLESQCKSFKCKLQFISGLMYCVKFEFYKHPLK